MTSIFVGNGLGLLDSSLTQLNGYGSAGGGAVGRGTDLASVNAATGDLVIQDQDEFLGGIGLDDTLLRTYNSLGATDGDNNDGWRISAYRSLDLSQIGTTHGPITRTSGDGHVATFTYNGTAWIGTEGSGANDTITLLASGPNAGKYQYTQGGTGLTELYDPASGLIQSQSDQNGNTLSYIYNAAHYITAITDQSGQVAYLDYTGNKLADIRLHELKPGVTTQTAADYQDITRVRYTYDGQGRLSSVTVDLTPADNSIADNNTFTTAYAYDGNSTRVSQISQTGGGSLKIQYIQIGGQYRVWTLTDGLNRTTEFHYDTTNRKTLVTDPAGNVTAYTYDSANRLTRVDLPPVNGTAANLQYVYDPSGNITRVTDGEGRIVNYTYDSHGNLTRSQDALGDTVDRTYDSQDRLLTETRYTVASLSAPSGALTTRYVYSADGKENLLYTISPEGRVTQYLYDAKGERTSSILYLGGFYAAGTTVPAATAVASWMSGLGLGLSQRTDSSYDLTGQIKTVTSYSATNTDGTGGGVASVRKYIYDANGRLLISVDPRGSSTTAGQPYVTSYVYDGLGRLTATTDGAGRATSIAYNDAGNTITTTAPGGLLTTAVYDNTGELISVAKGSTTVPNEGTTYYWYDADGRITAQSEQTLQPRTNTAVPRTYYIYDSRGRQVATVSPQGTLTELVYNNDNQVIRKIQYAGLVNTATLVDASGNPVPTDLVTLRGGTRAAAGPALDLDPTNTPIPGHQYEALYTTGGATITAVGSGLTLTDADSTVTTVTITLTNRPDGANETLAVTTTGTSIIASAYNSATGQITLSGADTVAHYQAVLRTLTYKNALATFTAGDRAIDISATDGTNLSNLATAVIRADKAPVAANDSYAGTEDTTLSTTAATGVLANDSDSDGPSMVAQLVTGPAHGTLNLAADGSFVYTPSANYNGTDSFTYRVTDGINTSGTATVTLTLAAVDDAPVAVGDSYNAAKNQALTVAASGVLANDTDIDSANLTAVLVTNATHGTVALNTNGSFTYTPNADYLGTDSFTYKASDGSLYSNVVTVTLNVLATNVPPVAANDSYSATEDTTLTVAAAGVLANDSDPAGLAITAQLVTNAAHGTVTLNADGSFTYIPNANYNGTDSFTYKAYNGSVTSGTATVTLTIAAVNDAPVAVNDSYSGTEDTTLTVAAAGVLTNDTDIDSGSLTAVLVTNAAHGTVTLNANGSFTYVPAANYNGTDSFTYKVSDGSLYSNVATVTLTIGAVNDPPVAVNDSYSGTEDTTLTVAAAGVLANDSDIDSSSLSAVLVTNAAHGTVTLNANGSFTYVPNANYNGSDSFTYKTSDGSLYSNVATVSLTVAAVNDPPVAVNDSYSGSEDTTLSIAAAGVLANDSDIDSGSLTAVLVTNAAHGTVTLNANGSFTYVPSVNYNGTDSFTYKVSDGSAYSNVATVTLNIAAVDDAPVAVNDSYSGNQDTTFTIAAAGVLANDTDVDGPSLTAQLVTNAAHGTVTLHADGSFTYVPTAGYYGSDSFTYQVSDGTLTSNIATVSLSVAHVDHAPVANDDSYYTGSRTFGSAAPGVLANDTDSDHDPLTAVLVSDVDAGTLTFNSNGSFTWVRGPGKAVDTSFSYKVYDGTLYSNVTTVLIQFDPAGTNVVVGGGSAAAHSQSSPQSLVTAQSLVVPGTSDRTTYYEYDAAGRLAYTIAGSDSTHYSVTGYQYDGADRKTSQTDYATVLSSAPADGNAANITVTATANDRTTRYFYDGDNDLTGVLDPNGNLSETVYDAGGEISRSIAYATPITDSALLASGTLAQLRAQATNTSAPGHIAGDHTGTTFYDGEGRVLASLDANGYLTANTYDAAGNLLTQTAYATAVNYTTQTLAQLTTAASVPGKDRLITYQYDALNRLTSQTDPEGTTTTYTYDSRGYLIAESIAAVAGTGTSQNDGLGRADKRTTSYFYDDLGRLTATLLGVGSTAYAAATPANQPAILAADGTSNTYDAAGRLIKRVEPVNGNGLAATTWYYYDTDGNLLYTVDSAGDVSGNQYDAFGDTVKTTRYAARISTTGLTGGLLAADSAFTTAIAATGFQTNPLNRTTAYTYGDNRGLLTQTIQDNGGLTVATAEVYNAFGDLQSQSVDTGASHGAAVRSDLYTYDKDGQLTQTTRDSGGLAIVTATTYDAFGRVLSTTLDPTGLNQKTQYTYNDSLGRVVTVTDPLLKTTVTTYDAFGRVLSLTDRTGATTTYAYTDTTQTQTVTDPSGDVITTLHNRHGQTIQISVAKAGVTVSTTTYTYDADGNLLSTKDGDNNLSSSTYDGADLLSTSTDANGTVTRYSYDAANRVLSRSVDPSGLNLVTQYAYNAFGQAYQVTDPSGVITQTVFDNLGRSTAVIIDTAGLKLATTYTYDALGDTLTQVEGQQGSYNATTGVWTYSAAPGTVTRTTQYAYDKLGRRTSQIVDYGSGKLNLTTAYAYDKAGNLVKKTDANGNLWRYGYDADNRQIYAVDPLGGVSQSDYDGEGRITRSVQYAAAINTASLADPPTAAGIKALLPASPSTTADRISWNIYDAAGHLSYSIDGLGEVTGYAYDAAGRLTDTVRYANRIAVTSLTAAPTAPTGLTANAADQHSGTAYDLAGRVIYTVDASGAVTKNGYDAAGNLVSVTAYATRTTVTTASYTKVALDTAVAAAGFADSAHDRITYYAYDNSGRQRYTLQVLGLAGAQYKAAVSETRYDADGRVTDTYRYANAMTVNAAAPTEAAMATLVAGNLNAAGDEHTHDNYDNAGRLGSVVDAAGYTQSYTYDGLGNKLSYTNQNGYTWNYAYDGAGRLALEVDPLVTTYTLATGATPGITVDGGGRREATQYTYDALGNITSQSKGSAVGTGTYTFTVLKDATNTYPDTITYNYDALGRQIQTTQPVVGVYSAASDASGHYGAARTETMLALSSTTFYDAQGNAIVGEDAAGTGVTGNFSYKIYNVLGQLAYDIDAERGVTAYSYDAFGNQTGVTRYASFIDQTNTTTGGGSSLATLEATLRTTPSAANAAAALAKAKALVGILSSANARTITTAYDALDRKIQVTQPAVDYYVPVVGGNALDDLAQGLAKASPTTLYTYDAFGDLLSQSTLIKPQPTGTQPNVQSYPADWATAYYGYDKAGRQTDSLDALGYYTRNTYDSFSRLTDTIQYARAQTVTVTGGVANFTALTPVTTPVSANNAAGYDRETAYQYDQLDRQTVKTSVGVQYAQLNGTAVANTTGNLSQITQYDGVGNIVAVTDPSGAITRTTYDALGHVVAVSAPTRASVGPDSAVTMRSVGMQYSLDDIVSGNATRLDVQWDSLDNWGTGNVVVSVTYEKQYWLRGDVAYDTKTVTETNTLAAAVGDDGISISPPAIDGHYSYVMSVDSITVQKYVGTTLVTVYDSSKPSSMIEIGSIPSNVASLQFQYQATGSTTWQSLPAAVKAGNFWQVDSHTLAAGSYNYKLTATDSAGHAVVLPGGPADGTLSGQLRVYPANGGTPYIQATGVTSLDSPLTTYAYDLLGHQVSSTSYANGGAISGSTVTIAAPDAANDQTSYSAYDLLGRVISSWDAAGKQQQNSYDKFGNLARTWRTQTDVLGPALQQVTLYAYDRNGRQTETDIVTRSALNTNYAFDKTQSAFNTFGEQTGKDTVEAVYTSTGTFVSGDSRAAAGTVLGTYREVYYYDDGGHLWQTDQGGVDTVYRYDLQGDTTARIVVPLQLANQQTYQTTAGQAYDPTQPYVSGLLSAPSQVTAITGRIETDTAYDALGRAVQESDPQFTQDAPTANDGSGISLVVTADHRLLLTVLPGMGQTFNSGAVTYTSSAQSGTLVLTAAGTNVWQIGMTDAAGHALSGAISYNFSIAQSAAGITPTASTVDGAIVQALNTYAGTFTVSAGTPGNVTAPAAGITITPIRTETLDRWGNVLSVTDPRNSAWATTYRYDYLSHQTVQTLPQVDVLNPLTGASSLASPTSTSYYDARGLQIGSTDADGHTVTELYDAGGNLVQTYNPDAGVVTDTYDTLGRRIADEDGRGDITVYGYDKLNRLIRQETLDVYDINGNHVDPVLYFTYDEAGNRTSASDGITDSGGNAVNLTRYRYDTQGRVVASMTPLAGTNYASIYKTTFSYDAEGHETSTTDGDGNTQSWSYDYFGRELTHTDLGGHSVSDQYDAWGRLSHRAGSGQDLTYAYYANGWLRSEQENFSGADSRLTLYRYDAAGNHILERYSDLVTGQSWQDTRISYDAEDRVSQVRDDRYDIAYAYDAVGNREHTAVQDLADPTQPANTGTVTHLDYWYQYDGMNRLTLSQGSLVSGQIVIGSAGTAIAYDLGGERRMTTFAQSYTSYDYDTAGRLVAVHLDTAPNGGAPDTVYTYDQAGRQTSAESYANQGLQPETGRIAKSFYNANGQLITENQYTDDGLGHLSLQTRVRYSSSTASDSDTPSIASDTGYYDGAGNATQYTMHNTPQNYDNTYQLTYARYAGYQQQSETATTNYVPPSGSYIPGNSTETFDAYGHLTQVQLNYGSAPTRGYIVDAGGHILQQTLYNANGSQNAQQSYYYVHGAAVGNAGNLVAGMADATATDAAVNRGETPNTPLGQTLLSDATFAAGAPDPTQQTTAGPGQYLVQSGDSLQSIATAVWGDSSLWYLIADANGLTGNGDLVTGQSLTIPNQIGSLHNNANTSAPYNPQKILGDIGAQPNYVPPPKPQCTQGSMIVGAIVGAIVTFFTWNPVLGAAVGSVVQQDTYLAANGQLSTGKLFSAWALTGGDPLISSKYASDGKFSIGEVAIAAGAAAATAAVGGAGGGTATSSIGYGVAAGITGNAVQQLGDIAIGHQKSFDWASLAGAAVGGGVSGGVGFDLQKYAGFSRLAASTVSSVVGGVASSETQVLVNGYGHINVAAIAVDAFRNLIGNLAQQEEQTTPGEKLPSLVSGQDMWGNSGINFTSGEGIDSSVDLGLGDTNTIGAAAVSSSSTGDGYIAGWDGVSYGSPGGNGGQPQSPAQYYLGDDGNIHPYGTYIGSNPPAVPSDLVVPAGVGTNEPFTAQPPAAGSGTMYVDHPDDTQTPVASGVTVNGPKGGFLSTLAHQLSDGEFGEAGHTIYNEAASGVQAVGNFFAQGNHASVIQTLTYMLSQVDQQKMPIQVNPSQIAVGYVGEGLNGIQQFAAGSSPAFDPMEMRGAGIYKGLTGHQLPGYIDPIQAGMNAANNAAQNPWVAINTPDRQLGATVFDIQAVAEGAKGLLTLGVAGVKSVPGLISRLGKSETTSALSNIGTGASATNNVAADSLGPAFGGIYIRRIS